jgi:transposase
MWHIGIDLHRANLVLAAVHDSGQATEPKRIDCQDAAGIREAVETLKPFRAVIEATGTYRWLDDLLSPHGTALVAHPLRLRAMIRRRSKTDKLDSLLLANLLRIDQIPLSYVPPEGYQRLREITRFRARRTRGLAEVKVGLRTLLARHNRFAPYRVPFGPRGVRWFQGQRFGAVDDDVRDELLGRLVHYREQIAGLDTKLEGLRVEFPQVEALLDLRGIGLYSALVIVAELGEVERFRSAHQVGACAGLTARVRQSGGHCHHGSITREGSPWLRWILTEAAIKVVRDDAGLRNFSERVRKRSNAKVARVAVARKLAEICWKRLRRWHRRKEGVAA